jgi:hypothetical protein
MTTLDLARSFALALPDVVEAGHMGKPDFRVGGKVFASLPAGERMSLRLDPAEQAAVLATAPDAFTPAAGAWGRQGWTTVELAAVDADELRELVIGAWRYRAPRRVLAAYDAANPPA